MPKIKQRKQINKAHKTREGKIKLRLDWEEILQDPEEEYSGLFDFLYLVLGDFEFILTDENVEWPCIQTFTCNCSYCHQS